MCRFAEIVLQQLAALLRICPDGLTKWPIHTKSKPVSMEITAHSQLNNLRHSLSYRCLNARYFFSIYLYMHNIY
jgi:hypothetical protein